MNVTKYANGVQLSGIVMTISFLTGKVDYAICR